MANQQLYQEIFGNHYDSIPLAVQDREVFADIVAWMRSRGHAPQTKYEAQVLANDATALAAWAVEGLGRDDRERLRSRRLAFRLNSAKAMIAIGSMLLKATRASR